MRPRVFSGIQPTGTIHLGNLIGAFSNWVAMQDEYDCIYCVVDLHAITAPFEPAELGAARTETAKAILAAGVDPRRSLLYRQADVPEHAELMWLLGVDVTMGPLGRMTQYKEKSDKAGERFGLFAYPVLQAADILIHKVDAVPVGEDQTQHLELTRDIAERFNNRYGETFPIPERVTPPIGARVASLADPMSKMSKSDPNPAATVGVFEDPDSIMGKFKRAVTDSGSEVRYDWDEKPGISNLLEIHAHFTGRSIDDLVTEYGDTLYGHYKVAVGEAVVEGLRPIRERYEALDAADVETLLSDHADRAREMAARTIGDVKAAMGLGSA
jgi:tryptophanyl-tRNA synthetase